MRVSVALVFVAALGCDSNPTPHPQNDAYDARADTQAPEGGGPDDDGDGVPDCAEVGGYWDGNKCQGDITAGVDSGGDLGPDVTPPGDVADAIDDAIDDANETDGGDAGDGEMDAEGDSGPDASE